MPKKKKNFNHFKSETQDLEQKILKNLDNFNIDQISEHLYDIRKEFYTEKPVDITTFIFDKRFLGNSLAHVFYPIWHRLLKKIHISPFVNNFYEIILEAPLGSGKSYVSAVSILYEVYKLILLNNPQEFYNLGAGTRIYFLIFSVTLDSADINWKYIKTLMLNSPFFQELMNIVNKDERMKIGKGQKLSSNEQNIFKDVYIAIGSNTDHSISRAIFGGQLDEGNFQKKSSNQAYENYDALITRIESRFMSGMGNPPGVLWLTSSPTFESSFSTSRIQASKGLDSTLVIENIPIWKVLKGTDKFKKIYKSNKSFYVFTGDTVRDPFIITKDNKELLKVEQKLLKVPYEHFGVFKRNTPKALRDNAGFRISVTSNLFRSKDSFKRLMTAPNKFITPIDDRFVELSSKTIGNTGTGIIKCGMKSQVNLIDFLNREYFENILFPYSYRFIHIDIGAKIDRCGISSSFGIYTDERMYQTTETVETRKQRFIYNEWAIALEALEGDEIPFNIIINVLVYLKNVLNYPIELVTTDQREGGRKLRQDLQLAGFNTGYLSMDKSRVEYDEFQDLCLEERCILTDVPLLFLEATELQDNEANNPIIDHPKYFTQLINGKAVKGTKDIIDSVAGSVINVHRAKVIANMLHLYNQAQAQNQNNFINNATKMYNQNMINKFGNKLYKNF